MIGSTKINPNTPIGTEPYTYTFNPPISQTNLIVMSFQPGYRGVIINVRAWARTVNGATVTQVNIAGSTNVLASAITPTTGNAAPAVGTLVANSVNNKRFKSTDYITIALTTGGTAPVDLTVEVDVRPFPMAGEGE